MPASIHSGAGATYAAPSQAAGTQGAPRQSAFFRVSRGAQVAYLFGTIHVGAKSIYPLAPEVSKALAESTSLVLELDGRSNDAFQRAVAQHASYPEGDHIANHVSSDTLARLTKALHAIGIPLSEVSRLKPWLLANLLLGYELQRHGYDRNHGNEFVLMEQASARGTAVKELESADYQLALFDTLSRPDAEAYLRESLSELADGSALRKAKATIAAWHSGDTAALDALMDDATSGDTIVADFTKRMLLAKRNPEMADRIDRIMGEGKTAFVGVGLLHLLGADGVPRLLAQRGYAVERVY
jgi:uncharacterized protein